MPVTFTIDRANRTARFAGLDEHIKSVSIPIEQLTIINTALAQLDSRIDALEAQNAQTETYTVSFEPATTP